MRRTKIDYGIDLGTTNSAVARIEKGKPVITKSDAQMDTMPSCVNINKKGSIIVGISAANTHRSETLKALKTLSPITNTFIEFKRTMGTDKKYHSSNVSRDFTSEQLSAEVLKALKSFVTDDTPKSVVVTVPAKFTINQKDATTVAASIAGFEHCELLQEPIAASMAYGVAAETSNGRWMVFDFGGGTFDAALLNVEEGIMKVIDTEGDNHLGGKDIDLAIVDEILLPRLQEKFAIGSIQSNPDKQEYFRIALKNFAEDAKIQLSFSTTSDVLSDPGDFPEDDDGNEIELDITITRDDLEKVTEPIFQKAVDICKDLLKRNGLNSKDLGTLILVGGPTWAPLLRQMLQQQITKKVDTTIDPMTAVAEGAALYASTVNVSEEIVDRERDRTKIQLDIKFEPTTVETSELVTIRILEDKTEGEIPDKVFAEIIRGDKGWSSGKVEINSIGEIFEPLLQPGRSNSFSVVVYDDKGDMLPNEPDEFTILQGIKPGQAILSYNFGIEVRDRRTGKLAFMPLSGLEKNQPYPATGISSGLVTQKPIGPGTDDSILKIALYEGEEKAEWTRPIYNEHVYDANIVGDDLPGFVPAGSPIDLTVRASVSGITISVYFPTVDYTYDVEVPTATVQKEIDADWLNTEIVRTEQSLAMMEKLGEHADAAEIKKIDSELQNLKKLFDQGRGDYDRKMQVLLNLRGILKKIDVQENKAEWPYTEKKLKDRFYSLEAHWKEVQGHTEGLSEPRIIEGISRFREQIPEVIKNTNIKLANELIEEMDSLGRALADATLGVRLYIQWIKEWDEEFDLYKWTDPNKARILINQGLSMAANDPTKESMRALNQEIAHLVPDPDKADPKGAMNVPEKE